MIDVTTSSAGSRITVIPDLCNGRPTVRGLRITVATVLGYLAAGESIDEVLRQHPMLEREDIFACLDFASGLLDRRYEIKSLVA
jgi:uncharacterized protein (DUF433 family)